MIKTVKFGGSSLSSAEQFRKARDIILSDEQRRFIIVSAAGKENEEDHKVTDLLYLCDAHNRYGVSYEDILALIEKKYFSIRDALDLSVDLDSEFAGIRRILQEKRPIDELVSRGEYLCAKLMAEYIGGIFIDARDVIIFDYDGRINLEKSAAKLKSLKTDGKICVIPGFYGAMPNGDIRLLSRGGSDITGAVIANIVDADIYENWTDVSGILVTDPRIVEDPLPISRINYDELREMSYMGANVLNDEAIAPVKEKGIPINIRNTNDPTHPGTMIMADCSDADLNDPPHFITGITAKTGFTAITVVKNHSASAIGFLRSALKIFEDYRIPVESLPISVDCFSILVSDEKLRPSIYEVIGKLKEQVGADEVYVNEHIALLAVVGRAMQSRIGMSGQIFSELGNNRINIKTISQGADEISIIIGVEEKDCNKAIRTIYDRFVKGELL